MEHMEHNRGDGGRGFLLFYGFFVKMLGPQIHKFPTKWKHFFAGDLGVNRLEAPNKNLDLQDRFKMYAFYLRI